MYELVSFFLQGKPGWQMAMSNGGRSQRPYFLTKRTIISMMLSRRATSAACDSRSR
jgi:hypothetical protein